MRYAIISDIHGNKPALDAAIADIASRGIKHIMCLGDIVGLGPWPAECIDTVSQSCFLTLLGNCDYSLIHKSANNSVHVTRTLDWSRSIVEQGEPELAAKRWKFLAELPERYDKNGISFVHGSPRDPVGEYLFPDDVKRDPRKLLESFELFEKVLFVGHTHIPGVFRQDLSFTHAKDLDWNFHYRKGTKVIINVGSVSHARNGDTRVCYIEINKNDMNWHTVSYDLETVAQTIETQEALGGLLARRLREAY